MIKIFKGTDPIRMRSGIARSNVPARCASATQGLAITCIEKMPIKKRVPFHAWAFEIVCWAFICYAVLYFTPVCWRIFTR
ncbi:MAG: hypothetical protein WC637_00400 [Victivallales bacterium]